MQIKKEEKWEIELYTEDIDTLKRICSMYLSVYKDSINVTRKLSEALDMAENIINA